MGTLNLSLEELISERVFWFEYGLENPHYAELSKGHVKHLDGLISAANTQARYFLVSDENGNSIDWIASDNWG